MDKTLVAAEEFTAGKHGIYYVSPSFSIQFKNDSIEARPMPTFKKLDKAMADEEIESELKPGVATLGDLIAFLDNASEECKDGDWNLFYFPGCVVFAFWIAGRGWYVYAYLRDDRRWLSGSRVVSPATDA